jgi:hypothetical protein
MTAAQWWVTLLIITAIVFFTVGYLTNEFGNVPS